MSFPVALRTRNGHEVCSKLFVGGFACNAGVGPIWHLGLDGLGRDSV